MEKLIKRKELKWIFISGKGGVGKTSCSCAIASELSKHRDNVLLISTDPAHNLSDSWSYQFNDQPCLVPGYQNLYCMEFNNKRYITELNNSSNFKFGETLNKLLFNLPGVEEALGYIKLIKDIMSLNYSTIIFDTAPTGHTLKLLEYPHLLKEAYYQLTGSTIGNIFKTFMGALYTGSQSIEAKLDDIINNINLINYKLTNPNFTTFINVCIPEFLSVFETERFIQQLLKMNIDTYILIINQVLEVENSCQFIKAREKMQERYLQMIDELYLEDFDIIQLPLFETEIRGKKNIEEFGQLLYNYYDSEVFKELKKNELSEEELDKILQEALDEFEKNN